MSKDPEERNLLLEEYGRFKRMELRASPFCFLLESNIEPNPHQLNALCAAIDALPTGGIVLADEVGLGKTIEAGLVLSYVLKKGSQKVLIVLPASLRKQWELEMEEKFKLSTVILDRMTVEHNPRQWHRTLLDRDKKSVIITSYDYSSKLMRRFPDVKWDFIIIDEAHNLRNVFHGTKRANRLYKLSSGIPKILLTATPLQNSLLDLHGLISFIDPRIFGPEKVFKQRYMNGEDYDELKRELTPVLYRTLRRDVAHYMNFRKRICRTVNFELSPDEIELYERVNRFLKREVLHSIPASNRTLVILVIRKLMASSSYALVETFEVLRNRLEKLYAGTHSANAQEGFDLFWSFVEDEIDESGFDESIDEETAEHKASIQAELDEVQTIIDVAKRIRENSKINALKQALDIGFSYQNQHNIREKVVIFTESKRTQKYIASELRRSGYVNEDILLFNGDFNDEMTRKIYQTWRVKNFDQISYGRSVEYKHAIVDYFKYNAKILICTDAGSEGLNLQFCNTVINYDLPWNPMKIEQRIGRCHRYGQKNDVVAINLLNTQNIADRRVYEILSRKFELFEGVFGASDIALGVLESSTSFEKMVLNIYQSCNTEADYTKAFDKLDKKLSAPKNDRVRKLRSILLTESSGAKQKALEGTKQDLDRYLQEVEYWNSIAQSEYFSETQYWKVDNWGEQVFGSHGYLFLGALCDNAEPLQPVLLLCDEKGNYVDFDEKELVPALELVDDSKIHYFTPTDEEEVFLEQVYVNLKREMLTLQSKKVEPIKAYNKQKIQNWIRIQNEQLILDYQKLKTETEELQQQVEATNNFYEKIDIKKKADQKLQKLEAFQSSLQEKREAFEREGEREIIKFNQSLDVKNPILLISVVLKF